MKTEFDNTENEALSKTDVMRGYFGLDLDFKFTAKNGDVFFLSNNQNHLITLSKLNLEELKMQQFTGVLDRNKTKIYFGDTLRFADKWEWYKGTWAWKFMGKIGEEREKLQKEYDELPFEERLIENKDDFEWLLSSEIQSYWQVIV
jgi:hypothetical protein